MRPCKQRKWTVIEVIVFIVLLSACQVKIAKDTRNSIAIPIDLTSQRPVLELMIKNTGPYKFIFDTGSSGISQNAPMNTLALRQLLPVDGILSPAFFSDYLITIDYSNSKLFRPLKISADFAIFNLDGPVHRTVP